MAYTRAQICNRALAKIGDYIIVSLGDKSDTAVTLNSMYDLVRDAEISANCWGFALSRAVLPALEEAPAFGYDRKFQLPVDCLRVVEVGRVWPEMSQADYMFGPNASWEIEEGAVLTNYPAPLHIRYLKRIEDPAKYPATFIEAFACKLAIEISPRISGKNSNLDTLAQFYQKAIKDAIRVNAIQRAPQQPQDSSWMRSRVSTTGGGYAPGGGY